MWDCGETVQTKAWRALAVPSRHDATPGKNNTEVFTVGVNTEMDQFILLQILLGDKFKRGGRTCYEKLCWRPVGRSESTEMVTELKNLKKTVEK